MIVILAYPSWNSFFQKMEMVLRYFETSAAKHPTSSLQLHLSENLKCRIIK